VIELDILAKRYGKLPSEVMQQDLTEMGFNLFVAEEGLLKEKKVSDKQNKKSQASMKKYRR